MYLERLNQFSLGPDLLFGVGAISHVPEIINREGFKKVMIICDEGIEKAQILEKVLEKIRKSNAQITVFSNVEANPTTDTVKTGMHLLKKFRPDLLIGLGGGSPIDVAKALGILATNGGRITDYEGIDRFSNQPLPLLAIPTTAGTGSEVTIFTVVTDPIKEYKLTVGGSMLAPKWAVIAPALTITLPPKLTAATGLDALVHAIESYTSTMSYALTETLALDAIRTISSNLRQAVFNGENLSARRKMLYGSLVAGIAFNNTRLGNVHAMSHPLSAKYHVPHGVANSVLLPHVMEFNLPAAPGKFLNIAKSIGEYIDPTQTLMANAYKAIEAVKQLSRDIHIPKDFSEYQIRESDILPMAEDAMKSGNIAVNPRKTNIEDVVSLYKKTMGRTSFETDSVLE
ncbi:alcohol dehydrogenase [Scopulibacillus darangshiensis]|uniref:Alcohol dehydrogenase n=1 Tax=Scopulibacillus darangshiensis TaxID=442528 RepID=A0A4R2NUK8_9BACL|nr:iron-containing alcohol dehydrogenase [Scopulibacillus darangshiensis]TCP25622.1 alcohol dehydrogenase [Scopulibacillus darangshiensis]